MLSAKVTTRSGKKHPVPAEDRRLNPDHHPGTENSKENNIENQELIPKSNVGNHLQKGFPGSDIQVNIH